MTLTETSSARCVACGAIVSGPHACNTEPRQAPRMTELERTVLYVLRAGRIRLRARFQR